MKNLSKKVILSIFSLILVATILGTSTYAWFTIGDTVAVNEFEVKVQGGVGLEFTYVTSDDVEKGYVSRLTEADLKSYLSDDYGYTEGDFDDNFKLTDVTSEDGIVFKKLNSTNYDLDGVTKQGGYIEFKLRFRTKEMAEAQILWSDANLFNDNGLSTWEPGNSFNIPGGGIVNPKDGSYSPYTYFSSHAARISVTGSIYDEDEEVSNDETLVYELPEGNFGGSLSGNPKDYLNTVLSNGIPASGIQGLAWNSGALEYFNKSFGTINGESIESIYNKSTGTSKIMLVETIQEIPATGLAISDFKVIAGLNADYRYAEVVVRVYIEGFDAEAFDGVLENELKAMLEFKFKLK